jgi:hypothetical protein
MQAVCYFIDHENTLQLAHCKHAGFLVLGRFWSFCSYEMQWTTHDNSVITKPMVSAISTPCVVCGVISVVPRCMQPSCVRRRRMYTICCCCCCSWCAVQHSPHTAVSQQLVLPILFHLTVGAESIFNSSLLDHRHSDRPTCDNITDVDRPAGIAVASAEPWCR